MTHNCNHNSERLPMAFIIDARTNQVNFATNEMVMEGDEVVCLGLRGKIKEIIKEVEGNQRWVTHCGHESPPTIYHVQLQ